MPYQIIFEKSARKEIQKINRTDRANIMQSIYALANNPRPTGCIKLKGRDAWRIRINDYRVIYEIQDDVLVVTIIKVSHRRDVYK
jgi:mRNA interferase RelE/StbE